MTDRYERIRHVLQATFQPSVLKVEDDSARHASHVARNGVEGDETHFCVTMTAQSLSGRSRLERSRAVHEALAAEFASGLHALSLTLKTPEEDKVQR